LIKEIKNKVMAKKIKTNERMDFNTWARTFKVSSLWEIHKPENVEFIERLENYRYAISNYPSKETEDFIKNLES
jgi:hypothetical protein